MLSITNTDRDKPTKTILYSRKSGKRAIHIPKDITVLELSEIINRLTEMYLDLIEKGGKK